jgi:hypothetical protein
MGGGAAFAATTGIPTEKAARRVITLRVFFKVCPMMAMSDERLPLRDERS